MAIALRGCLAVLVGGVCMTATAAPAAAEDFFQAQTTATAVHVIVTQKPAGSIITASLFDDALAYAASDFDTGGASEALAASAFPGRLVTQGPQLLCSQLFPCPVDPPAYPLLADASYPRRQHDTAAGGGQPMGSGPVVVTPLTAAAHAGSTDNAGQTSAGDVSLLTGTPGAVSIRTSTATSSVRSTAGGVDLHVETLLSDIVIGGVVHIGSIRAVDDIHLGTGSQPRDRPSITVSDVTAAGQAASIDNAGIHVAGKDGPAVTRRLSQHGVTLRTVGAHRVDTSNSGRSEATGVEVDVALPVSGLPYVPNPLPPLPPPFDQVPALPGVNANGTYVGHITLGAVGAAAGHGREPVFASGGAGQPGGGPPGQPAPPGTTGGQPLAGGDLVSGLATTPTQPAPTVAPSQSLLRSFRDLLSGGQLETLYAVLALGSLGLFFGWRVAVLARRRPVVGGRRS
ncbi:MAG: hypothetical protein QOF18_155 [Frankiaceae bacterium]|nr:hypothetical protein [Frankiaceae bacterium]